MISSISFFSSLTASSSGVRPFHAEFSMIFALVSARPFTRFRITWVKSCPWLPWKLIALWSGVHLNHAAYNRPKQWAKGTHSKQWAQYSAADLWERRDRETVIENLRISMWIDLEILSSFETVRESENEHSKSWSWRESERERERIKEWVREMFVLGPLVRS